MTDRLTKAYRLLARQKRITAFDNIRLNTVKRENPRLYQQCERLALAICQSRWK